MTFPGVRRVPRCAEVFDGAPAAGSIGGAPPRLRHYPLLLLSALLVAATPSQNPAAQHPPALQNPPTTESAHFAVSHGRALDEVLGPYLVDALEAERERLAGTGVPVVDGKLPVEIVSSPGDLDRLTSLDAKDVARGIAAVCESGKLVLVSPRAATGGYPWVDAAVKEYGRCAGATAAPRGTPATVAVRWRGAPPPQKKGVAGGKAELARDFARLGDILSARGRNVAARIEYDKAVRRGGLKDPDIVARYARSALATGGAGAAEAPLRQAAREHPQHAGVQAALGKIEAQKGEWSRARDAYAAAIRVDPFDAEVHAGLAGALEALGDATGASREKQIAEMLRR
jgi:tetratricopeptide (TPR) repeat protein